MRPSMEWGGGLLGKGLELTPRLALLAGWVRPGARLADVGTDHGHLPVRLLLEGRIVSAIASDLRPGPLSRAMEAGRRYGVENIDFRLCDGLSAIGPEECDTVVIAGMGGENIAAILAAAPWTADGCRTLLLQPQSKEEVLRRFLMDHGYAIRREALALDRGVLYPCMEAGAGEMILTLGQLWGGARLTEDPLGDRYIIEKILRLQTAVAGLNRAGGGENQKKADALREIITALLSMREEWRRAKSRRN